MRRYTTLEHTSDLRVEVYGSTLTELFANAAFAMFDQMIRGEISDSACNRLAVDGIDAEDLLVRWLSELLYLFDTRGLVHTRFDVRFESENRLAGLAWGEAFDPGRHEVVAAIKAATYHDLAIQRSERGLLTRIVFDV